MLFDRALRRDLTSLSGVVFAALFTIMVTTTMVRVLGRASSNRVATADVLPLLAFASVSYLPILLVLTVYVAVLMSLSRAWRDSEMVVWFSSGQPLSAWVWPVLRFALPYALVVAVVAFEAGPWALRQAADYRARFEQREDISQVAAGQFRESASASRVFFVESLNEDLTEVRNVFVAQSRGDTLTVVSSAGGRIEAGPQGDSGRYLVLEQGRRYDGSWSAEAYRLMEFERYGVRLEVRAHASPEQTARAATTWQLLSDFDARSQAELAWRIGLPLSCLVMVLLAIPLAFVNPRAGQSLNLIVALLIYLIYSNLNGLIKAWIAQGRLDFALGVWLSHVFVLAIAGWFFWRRTSLFRFRAWLASRGARAGRPIGTTGPSGTPGGSGAG